MNQFNIRAELRDCGCGRGNTMIRTFLKSTISAAGLAAIAVAAQAESVEDLTVELDAMSQRIADAELIAMSDEPEAVREIAKLRLEVLELSRALLENRVLAIEGGNVRRIVVAGVEPDLRIAELLEGQLVATTDRIRAAREDAAGLEGVEGSIARIRLETELLTRSQLMLAYYQAAFGIRLPGTSDPGADSAEQDADLRATDDPDVPGSSGRPPSLLASEVGSSSLVRRELARGAVASGWWTVLSDPDDSTMSALNFSAYRDQDDPDDMGKLLEVQCSGSEFSISFLVPGERLRGDVGETGEEPGFDAIHQFDQSEGTYGRWAESPGGQGASLFDSEARELFFELANAQELSIDVWEADNSLHSGSFDLAGFLDVAEAAVEACLGQAVAEEEPILFARQDYRLIQTLLNIAGFDAGGADGIWGPRSQSAMRQYQHSAGLAQTGHPNQETLELLGLAE